jgi:hypothetical protein
MCMPTNKTSLIKAVEDLVRIEFLANGKKFSAYDVTVRLRELVLQQGIIGAVYPIDIAETGTVFVQGQRVAKIQHDDVRHIVHELFTQGVFGEYNKEDNGQFFVYEPTGVAPTDTTSMPLTSNGPWSIIG